MTSNTVFTLGSSQKSLKKLNWMFLKYLDFLIVGDSVARCQALDKQVR